ncbi:hypothetical protein HHE06_07950 [Helicobacter heilmannii]|nr:hypothetical protein HHE03_15170 [Helicobacter heilmannii]CRF50937.1 hypothetical protein HHE06_07950 [Helicobacter heilmannii]
MVWQAGTIHLFSLKTRVALHNIGSLQQHHRTKHYLLKTYVGLLVGLSCLLLFFSTFF